MCTELKPTGSICLKTSFFFFCSLLFTCWIMWLWSFSGWKSWAHTHTHILVWNGNICLKIERKRIKQNVIFPLVSNRQVHEFPWIISNLKKFGRISELVHVLIRSYIFNQNYRTKYPEYIENKWKPICCLELSNIWRIWTRLCDKSTARHTRHSGNVQGRQLKISVNYVLWLHVLPCMRSILGEMSNARLVFVFVPLFGFNRYSNGFVHEIGCHAMFEVNCFYNVHLFLAFCAERLSPIELNVFRLNGGIYCAIEYCWLLFFGVCVWYEWMNSGGVMFCFKFYRLHIVSKFNEAIFNFDVIEHFILRFDHFDSFAYDDNTRQFY